MYFLVSSCLLQHPPSGELRLRVVPAALAGSAGSADTVTVLDGKVESVPVPKLVGTGVVPVYH
jgi:hypothetical protein